MIAYRSSTYVSTYALSALPGRTRRTIAVRMPARIISVPAAGSHPNVKVMDDRGLPLAPRISRPGHGNFTVQGVPARASLTGPRLAMEKMAMMMRYGA
jgi:hypothetical protein